MWELEEREGCLRICHLLNCFMMFIFGVYLHCLSLFLTPSTRVGIQFGIYRIWNSRFRFLHVDNALTSPIPI